MHISGRNQFTSLRVKHFSCQDLVTRHPFTHSSKAIEPWDLGVSSDVPPRLAPKLLHPGLWLLQGMIMTGVHSMKKDWNTCYGNGVSIVRISLEGSTCCVLC